MIKNANSSAPHFTSHQTLPQSQGLLRIELYLFYSYGCQGNFGETGPKYPKSCLGTHTQSNPGFSTLHFTLNEVLQRCKSYLMVELSLFQVIWGISRFSGNWVPVPKFYYLDIWSFKFAIQNGLCQLFQSSSS